MTDPIGAFEHTHADLTKVALEIGQAIRDEEGQPRKLSAAQRKKVRVLLERLRDDVLHHFADEEEVLFPFVRRALPERAAVVDKLEASHDLICGTVVRLAHLVGHSVHRQLGALYARFERAYGEHSRDELALFDELRQRLVANERAELASLLRELSER